MIQVEKIKFKEFLEYFATEDACRSELLRLRFAEGFVCPKGGVRVIQLHQESKRPLVPCCRYQTFVTAGTVMCRACLPLTIWFGSSWLLSTDKWGSSTVQLANTLGICYSSTWHLLDRIRATTGQPDTQYLLNKIVEMDDGYVSKPCHGNKRSRGSETAHVLEALSKQSRAYHFFCA